MILGLSANVVVIAAGLVALLGLVVAVYFYVVYRTGLERRVDSMVEGEDTIEFSPPTVRRNPLDYWRVMRHLQRESKLAKKGYVKWYRIDSQVPKPTWVNPSQEGQGTPKYEVDGQPYYFPREAMLTDQTSGAWVAVHREGEGDPINLRDPAYPGIETDLVERIINLEAEDSPSSGFFDGFDLSTQQLVYGSVAMLFVVYAGYMWYTGAI